MNEQEGSATTISAGNAQQPENRPAPPLRVWPAVIIISLQGLAIFGVQRVTNNGFAIFMGKLAGPVLCTLLLLIWWAFASRLAWRQRGVGLLAFVVACMGGVFLVHPTMRFNFMMYPLPMATTLAVVGLALTKSWSWGSQKSIGLLGVVLGIAPWTLARLDGVNGEMQPELSFRWSLTEEQLYLRQLEQQKADKGRPAKLEELVLQPGDWPAFRGPNRDSRYLGPPIRTKWEGSGPPLLWRKRIGPGWGSVTVVNGYLFTQEQRGDSEAVVCYALESGEPVWVHEDPIRFYETVSGAGPRATPTFVEGRVYTNGAEGTINCLDATTGKVLWNRDLVQDTGARIPMWGFSSSPIVVEGTVIVFAGGGPKKALVGYDARDGSIRWTAGDGLNSYSSPQVATFFDQSHVLISTDFGLEAIQANDGTRAWAHDWEVPNNARIVQPAVLEDNSIVLGTGSGTGTRRIQVAREGDTWSATELWESNQFKPYFNDFVLHQGQVYGFDGNIFCCIDLETGKRRWKQGRYGSGQVLLLAEQGQLLVLGEDGQVIILDASADKLVEHNRFQAIEGKTWNHPVVAHGMLLVRNGQEAACYDVSLSDPTIVPGAE